MILLDGKKYANKINENLKEEIKNNNYLIKLEVILVGNNFASEKYVNSKKQKAKDLGIELKINKYNNDVSEEELINKIKELNLNNKVNGIFVQLPLPSHINVSNIINVIDPKKDVDGFTPLNIGNLVLKEQSVKSCTPYGIMKLLKEYNITTKGKDITVIGTSNIVGKPLINMLMNEEATVTSCNSKTKNLKDKTINADIIIVATGVINLITEDMVKDEVIIIDVGINKNKNGKLVGDVDFENVSKKCSFITPVPGGVGPLTIAMLMKNTLDCYKTQKN